MNPPIVTNTYVNILDNRAPFTEMQALPETVVADTLTLMFQSSDGVNGSGVDNVVVFGSLNGGGFRQVAVSTTNRAQIPVTPGVWSFYALASDVVGNTEYLRPALVTTTVVAPTSADEGDIPVRWSLGANYPNPFNPTTNIPFSIERRGEVMIRLYDVLGRRVLVLSAGHLEPGHHVHQLDLGALASGTYFYEIRVSGDGGMMFRETRKLLLLK
jgi:hypothetical protein